MENENINIIPKRNIPRDVFLHLLAIVTLYWSAVSFVTLMWQYINYFFPDVLNNYNYFGFTGPIRFAVASLIIVFPIFVAVSWCLNKIYRREAVVRESKIRKWLIYLTLFITSITIIIDLVTIINTLLGGEITIRFILKAVSILAVAIVVFGYYLDDVRKETPAKSGKYFAWISGIVILASIIGAFFIVGTPNTARLMQFDSQKITDLQNIQYQVVNYYQRTGVLPPMLGNLTDNISGYSIPIDPQTKASYEYFTVMDTAIPSFDLCANFNKQNSREIIPIAYPIGTGMSQNWQHETGRTCFTRTIDPQLYPIDFKLLPPINPPK